MTMMSNQFNVNADMEERTITVTGRGGVHIVPDVTRVKVSVSAVRPEYGDCYEVAKENNAQLSRIMVMMRLDPKLPKTTRLDISQHYRNVNDKYGHYDHREPDGFELSQSIKIDLGIDNELLSKLVKCIGSLMTGVEIQIGYTVMDPRPAQMKMLERAVKDAKEKARIMVAAAGCQLGPVMSITYAWRELEVYSQARAIHSSEEARVCCSESLDISPDDLAASDDVTVVWRIIQ